MTRVGGGAGGGLVSLTGGPATTYGVASRPTLIDNMPIPVQQTHSMHLMHQQQHQSTIMPLASVQHMHPYQPQQSQYGGAQQGVSVSYGTLSSGGQQQQQSGDVLMVYGVDSTHMNCDRIFNLFCLYGNVLRVKFMKTKRDTCMLEMADLTGCARAIECLSGARMFGKELTVRCGLFLDAIFKNKNKFQ
jgi:hypothetical protein